MILYYIFQNVGMGGVSMVGGQLVRTPTVMPAGLLQNLVLPSGIFLLFLFYVFLNVI